MRGIVGGEIDGLDPAFGAADGMHARIIWARAHGRSGFPKLGAARGEAARPRARRSGARAQGMGMQRTASGLRRAGRLRGGLRRRAVSTVARRVASLRLAMLLLAALLASGCTTYFPVNDLISPATLERRSGYRGEPTLVRGAVERRPADRRVLGRRDAGGLVRLRRPAGARRDPRSDRGPRGLAAR